MTADGLKKFKMVKPNQNIFTKYKEMYLINSYRNATAPPTISSFMLDTLSSNSATNVFIARRESDDAEQTFTYGDFQDGTYNAWLGGSIGHIKDWVGENLTLLKHDVSNTLQPLLIQNGINPYWHNSLGSMSGIGFHNLDVTSDFIITLIAEKEETGASERFNLGIQGIDKQLFCFSMYNTGVCSYLFNKTTYGYRMNCDGKFNISTTAVFRLFTFKFIGGVFSVDVNNIAKTLSAGDSTYTLGMVKNNNLVILGNRGDNSTGRINKYKHLGLVADTDLSGFDVSAYNLEIMNRYGIV